MVKKDNLLLTTEMTESNRKLHSPSRFARQNLLYVQEAGTLQSLQPHRCVREGLDSFLIMAVIEGKGTLEIAGEKSMSVQGTAHGSTVCSTLRISVMSQRLGALPGYILTDGAQGVFITCS